MKSKIQIITFSRTREVPELMPGHLRLKKTKHYVEVQINGVGFETECESQEKALDLAVKTAKALGIAYKKG